MASRGRLAFRASVELEEAIDRYFERCASKTERTILKSGNTVEIPKLEVPTLSGLACALGVD